MRPIPGHSGAPLSAFTRVFDALWARTRNPDANSEFSSGFRARRQSASQTRLNALMAPSRNDGELFE
jgi:hypothetical protein